MNALFKDLIDDTNFLLKYMADLNISSDLNFLLVVMRIEKIKTVLITMEAMYEYFGLFHF